MSVRSLLPRDASLLPHKPLLLPCLQDHITPAFDGTVLPCTIPRFLPAHSYSGSLLEVQHASLLLIIHMLERSGPFSVRPFCSWPVAASFSKVVPFRSCPVGGGSRSRLLVLNITGSSFAVCYSLNSIASSFSNICNFASVFMVALPLLKLAFFMHHPVSLIDMTTPV